MAHTRKKGGERKDKKLERMREDIATRKSEAAGHPTTDQPDIITYKSGSEGDNNRQHHP
jgi:hypothetical protein